jgi:hypothetical protein
LTNLPIEPLQGGPQGSAPFAPSWARASLIETLAYTCAVDLCGENPAALPLAKDLLKDVRKSGLKAPFSEALLRRLALAVWTKKDRPRPSRLDSNDPKESAILLFFLNSWGATYEDLATALSVSEDRVRHLIHRARMDQIAAVSRIPIPKPDCRRPRELLSDYLEDRLPEPLADDVTLHLRECRECAAINLHLRANLAVPPRPLIEAPADVAGNDVSRPVLSLSFDGVSRTKRAGGIVLLAMGVLMGAVQLDAGLNAAASAEMDRLAATYARWRGRAERLMEDLRVLKALAVGTVEGRTEELGQTLDEYVNAAPAAETSNLKNKPAPDAVLDSRDPKAKPQTEETQRPATGSPSPENP